MRKIGTFVTEIWGLQDSVKIRVILLGLMTYACVRNDANRSIDAYLRYMTQES